MDNFISNVTFSTAYYDIGRGNKEKWGNCTRSIDTYFEFFKNVKNINCNLVIYCEEINYKKIQDFVSDRSNVKIIVKPFNELDFYIKFFEKTKNLMLSDVYKNQVIRKSPTPHVPEYNHPEYNIINFNKISFVKESMNHFDSDYYGWIDFGFGHNKDYVKYTVDNDFVNRVTQGSKVFMRCFRMPKQTELFNPDEYYHNNPSVHGSSFLGTKESIMKFYSILEYSIDTSLNMGCIDDDQTQYAMAYLLDPNNFNLVQGNWFTHFC